VHKYTGSAPVVALHIPWDRADDYPALAAQAAEHGIRIGTINSNTFQDDIRGRQDRLAESLAALYARHAAPVRVQLTRS
jgi:L-rhamnose isomerase